VLILSSSNDVQDYSSADFTQSIEINEKKLLNMKDKLLQKIVAMTRLNLSNDKMLKKFLNNIIDDEMTMKHSTN